MEKTENCSRCDKQIPVDAVEGLCPFCLLLVASGKEDDFVLGDIPGFDFFKSRFEKMIRARLRFFQEQVKLSISIRNVTWDLGCPTNAHFRTFDRPRFISQSAAAKFLYGFSGEESGMKLCRFCDGLATWPNEIGRA
jgi:hypothetical protein